jgi:hypothetical protein
MFVRSRSLQFERGVQAGETAAQNENAILRHVDTYAAISQKTLIEPLPLVSCIKSSS